MTGIIKDEQHLGRRFRRHPNTFYTMKTNSTLLVIVCLLAVLTASRFMASSAKENTPSAAGHTAEVIRMPVLKVYSAKETNNAAFRCYAVKWKGQEVIVSDIMADSDYKVGDIIPVMAINMSTTGKTTHARILTFQVTSP